MAGPATGETVRLDLDFPCGARARIELSNLLDEKRRRFEVRFDHATLVYDDLAPQKLKRHRPGEGDEAVPVDAALPLTVAVQAFADAIRTGSRSLESLRLGVDVVSVLARADADIQCHPHPRN